MSFYTAFLKDGRPAFAAHESREAVELVACQACGMPSSVEVCGVCRIRETLEDWRAARDFRPAPGS